MNKIFLAVMLAVSNVHEAFADDRRSLLRAQLSLKQAAEFCLQEGHQFRVLANPIVMIDLGGTSEPEVIFDYGALACDGDSWLYRGTMGSAVEIFSAEDDDGYLSKNGYELVPFKGHWAAKFTMSKNFANGDCSGGCSRYVYVKGNSVVESYK